MLTPLQARVPFGPANDPAAQAPWPIPASFSLDWLAKSFVPFQESNLRTVTESIDSATKQIESIRKEASGKAPQIGTVRLNGTILRTDAEQRLQREMDAHAKQQVAARIIEIRNSLDKTVPPILKTMHRGAQSAQTLSARFFDRLSCMSRFNPGLGKAELIALKANYSAIVRDMAPIELHRLAQNALDSADNLQQLVLLDVIRCENFRRPKDTRAFENAQLVNLIPVAEFDQAQPLLQRVVDLHNEALAAWFDFSGKTNRATTLRMGHAIGQMKLKEQTVPVGE